VSKAKPIGNIDCHDAAVCVIQTVLLARLKKLCALRERALDWNDTAGVHQMRVASRRLRSALSDFKPYLRKGSIPSSRLKAIGKKLGAVRDEDVVLAALEKLRSQVDDKVADGIEAIAAEHRRQRQQARSALYAALKPATLTEFRDDFRDRLDTATKTPHSHDEENRPQVLTFGQLGTTVIGARLKQLSDSSNAFYHPLRTRELHQLRILAKRLRYAVELFTPCWGDEFKKIAKEIAGLQTSLGELHDCDAWIANLGARLKNDEKTGEPRNRAAVVWLLQHFLCERTKHYCHALACWHKWERDGFLERLTGMLKNERDFGAETPRKPKQLKKALEPGSTR